MREFCDKWKQHEASGIWTWSSPALLYLKDWHFTKMHKNYRAYETPKYFLDDWLNDWFETDFAERGADFHGLKESEADYKFVYWGPCGTRTNLHTDVLKSHSWSGNVVGIKRWTLFHPSCANLLEDNQGRCKFESLENVDEQTKEQIGDKIMCLEQYDGEIIFVPSGWYHSVDNMTDCISINHNWIDSESLRSTWEYLKKERNLAETLIEDCRELNSPEEFEQLVQRNVLMNCGMDYDKFHKLLTSTLEKYSNSTKAQNSEIDTIVGDRRCKYGSIILQDVQSTLTKMSETFAG